MFTVLGHMSFNNVSVWRVLDMNISEFLLWRFFNDVSGRKKSIGIRIIKHINISLEMTNTKYIPLATIK
jgi:hypothetical protein